MNSLRWLSQTYHLKTNLLRPCFPEITNEEYNEVVHRYAKSLTNNKRIFAIAILVSVIIWSYLAVLFLAPANLRQLLFIGFPRSLPPEWHTGAHLYAKFIMLAMPGTIGAFGIVTGAYIMFQSLPLYGELAKFPVLPLPSVVIELWSGVLRLYLAGALMWSFGVVLAELSYGVQLDILDISFLIAVSAFGLIAFSVPRIALNTVLGKVREEAVSTVLHTYSTIQSPKQAAGKMSELDAYVRSAVTSTRPLLSRGQILNVIESQLIPFVPVLIKAITGGHVPF